MKCYKIENNIMVKTEETFQPNTVCVCSPKELEKEDFKVAVHTIDECSRSGFAKFEAYDGYDFILLNIIDNNEQYLTKRTGIYIMPQMLVFVSEEPCNAINDVIFAFTNNKASKLNIISILYAFFNSLTMSDSEKIEKLEEEIFNLEQLVMDDYSNKDMIKKFTGIRKKLMFYKKYYEQLLDVAKNIEANANNILPMGSARYFKMFTDRVDRLNRSILNLRDYINQVGEAYQSQVDIGINKIMKLFTVIAAVFLPLNLLVGWYGMNFKYMPELQWEYGYPCVSGLAILIVLICILIFKKKKFYNLIKY